jgi:hypothetical protein
VTLGPQASTAKRTLSATLPFIAVAAFLICAQPIQAQTDPDSNATVIVRVYDFVGVPSNILLAAERHADEILRTAGAKVDWVPCPTNNAPDSPELCRSGWSAQTPGLRFIGGANKYQGAQFGSTAIPLYSTVYYERVTARARRDRVDADLPVFLGCVIAHELGHLLLRSPGHDPRGIMQAQWGPTQLHQALIGNLLFTKDQATRIQSQAHILASLPRTTPPPITP